jgi:hypothetical protein
MKGLGVVHGLLVPSCDYHDFFRARESRPQRRPRSNDDSFLVRETGYEMGHPPGILGDSFAHLGQSRGRSQTRSCHATLPGTISLSGVFDDPRFLCVCLQSNMRRMRMGAREEGRTRADCVTWLF